MQVQVQEGRRDRHMPERASSAMRSRQCECVCVWLGGGRGRGSTAPGLREAWLYRTAPGRTGRRLCTICIGGGVCTMYV